MGSIHKHMKALRIIISVAAIVGVFAVTAPAVQAADQNGTGVQGYAADAPLDHERAEGRAGRDESGRHARAAGDR